MLINVALQDDIIKVGSKVRVSFLASYDNQRIAVSFQAFVIESQIRVNTITKQTQFGYLVQHCLNDEIVWADWEEVTEI